MEQAKLFMVLAGCKPQGRNTEQHDIFFGIAHSLMDLKPEILDFWPEAKGKVHIDAWREVNYLQGYTIRIFPRQSIPNESALPRKKNKLFFINLGGYQEAQFEEFHYKFLVVSTERSIAIQQAKQTAFYKHFGFDCARSHIDDKYGIDIDDVHEIEDILAHQTKAKYRIEADFAESGLKDEPHIGYIKLDKSD